MPVNDAPVASGDTATVAEGGTVAIDLAANDTDADDGIDPASIQIVSGPASGSVVVNADGTVTYVHDGGETTSDSFTYTIRDASGAVSNVATVSIAITPVSDAPIATADTATVAEGGTAAIDLTANDTDADDGLDVASIQIFSGPAHGSVVINADGTISYTHDGSETTTDSMSYAIRDASGASSQVVSISLTVTPVNDTPVLVNNALAVVQGGAVTLGAGELSAVDVDGPSSDLTFSVAGVTGGQFERDVQPGAAIDTFAQSEVTAGGIRFVHDGSATAPTYQVSVSDGLVGTAPAPAAVAFTSLALPPELIPTPTAPAPPTTSSDPEPETVEQEEEEAEVAADSTAEAEAGEVAPMEESEAGASVVRAPSFMEARGRERVEGATTSRGFALLRPPAASIDLGTPFGADSVALRERPDPDGWDRGGVDPAATESLWLALDRMRRDLHEDTRGTRTEGGVQATVETISIAFSGALVAIALRSSALWAAALSSLPLWRRIDPLMVLGLSDEERRKLEDQQREARSKEGSEVGRVLDGGKATRAPSGK